MDRNKFRNAKAIMERLENAITRKKNLIEFF